MQQKLIRISLWLIIFLLSVNSVFAQQDEVLEILEEAKFAYQNKEFREAAFQLNKALTEINKQLIESLKSFLPEPFDGWDADKPEGSGSGLAMLSELSVKRRYFKRGTGKSLDVEIVSNASKIPNVRMWLSDPRLLNAEDGLSIEEVNDVRCITRYDLGDRYAEINILIGSSMLVIIRGFEAKDKDDVKKFAGKIRVNEMENQFP